MSFAFNQKMLIAKTTLSLFGPEPLNLLQYTFYALFCTL